MDIIARNPLLFSVKCLIFFIITLLILLCFVITVDIAGAREVYIILKNGSQKLRCLFIMATPKVNRNSFYLG